MFRWLTSRLRTKSFEERTVVAADHDAVTCQFPDGKSWQVKWDDIDCFAVETTSLGPFVEDVFFFLESAACRYLFPQSSQNHDAVLEHDYELPGFDSNAFCDSMSSTENARFVCWQRGTP
ncbi:hypothetical protein BH11PLA2_BH11PLA2_07880 [soil metagenome]